MLPERVIEANLKTNKRVTYKRDDLSQPSVPTTADSHTAHPLIKETKASHAYHSNPLYVELIPTLQTSYLGYPLTCSGQP